MEAFAFLKFWKSNSAKVAAGAGHGDGDGAETFVDSTASDSLMEDAYEEDSFFELELTLPNYDSRFPNPDLCSNSKSSIDKEIEPKSSSKSNPKPKPQSPMSFLRPASPKLRFFMFGKLKKSKQDDEFETGSVSSSNSSNSSAKRSNLDLFTVKFKIEDGSIVPKYTRSNNSTLSRSSDECYESSKRFSIDVVQRYLNRMKPMYAKTSKKCCETEKLAASPARFSASYPSTRKEREEKQSNRFKVKCKQLRKSKSASEVIGAWSPVNFPERSEHPHDGIEGAILHCKRSLYSSKGHSSLSRCSSDPSHEKLNQAGKTFRLDLYASSVVPPKVPATFTVNV